MRKLPTKEILIASHNKGKLREFSTLLAPFGMNVRTAAELNFAEPKETGTTFEENAAIKAVTIAKASNMVTLADDSGLCVEALDGAPGVYTADWAVQPDGSRDFAAAMARLEQELQEKGALLSHQRRAHFACVLCLAWPDGETEYFRGKVEGRIHYSPSGEEGFGYDPIFIPEGFNKTFAEMSVQEKNGLNKQGEPLSHRARALKAFVDALLEV